MLQTRLNRFATDAEGFLRISHDNRLRFPSTEIMQTRMRDKAATFTEIITDVLDELSDQHDGSTELLLDSYRLHDTWQKILSEFRLLVANRFGVFADDPLVGMQARAGNIEIYIAHLQQELKRLEKMPVPEGTLYLEPETWQQLSRIADAWHREYLQLWKGLTSENWRRDLQIYKDSLAPQLTRLQADLGQIQASLNQESAGEIKELASVAERLTQAIFIITLADILLIFGAYIYLRRRILRCPPWRAKRRRVVPGSREATRDTRRAEGAKGDPKGASERGVQSYGRPVCSRNELAMLWRNAG